jgi:tRNA (guanine-N7-)-methyltransferase
MTHGIGHNTTMSEPADTPDAAAPQRRGIRSFVIRAGRMTVAQQRAMDELWSLQGIDFSARLLDLQATYGRAAPLTVEVGFGNGAHLADGAAGEPQRNFLGIEVHPPGVGALLLAARERGLRNLRVIRHDAVDVLGHMLPPGSIDEIEILFPDPWHKKRHHKRRLIQAPFVELLATRLRVGGLLHLATDWEPYAEHMLAVLKGCELLENANPAGDYAPSPRLRASTRFEQRGARLGHTTRELLWRRISAASQ